MNEQLEQLAEQAGLGVKHNGIVLTKNVNAAEALENFAQLIVAECAKVIFETPVEYNEIDAMHRIRDNVKQHVGVET